MSEVKVIKTKVVGVTKRNEDGQRRQELIEFLSSGDELFLEREPDNEYDENAIAVYNHSWEKIGYINRELAQELAPQIDSGAKMRCVVTDITGGSYDKPNYGCNIKITVYPPAEFEQMYMSKKGNKIQRNGCSLILLFVLPFIGLFIGFVGFAVFSFSR